MVRAQEPFALRELVLHEDDRDTVLRPDSVIDRGIRTLFVRFTHPIDSDGQDRPAEAEGRPGPRRPLPRAASPVRISRAGAAWILRYLSACRPQPEQTTLSRLAAS